jgi:nitrogen fixation NifU-like protein
MKIHCGQMVEGALKAALEAEQGSAAPAPATPSITTGPTLADALNASGKTAGKIKIVLQS